MRGTDTKRHMFQPQYFVLISVHYLIKLHYTVLKPGFAMFYSMPKVVNCSLPTALPVTSLLHITTPSPG